MKYVRYTCSYRVLNTDFQTVLLVTHCYMLYTTFYQCSFVVEVFSCYNMWHVLNYGWFTRLWNVLFERFANCFLCRRFIHYMYFGAFICWRIWNVVIVPMYDVAYASNLQISFCTMIWLYMHSWIACLYYFRPRAGRKQRQRSPSRVGAGCIRIRPSAWPWCRRKRRSQGAWPGRLACLGAYELAVWPEGACFARHLWASGIGGPTRRSHI